MKVNPISPRVGVGVILVRDGLVLLGERLGSHGAGSWAPPGGHLEFGETVEGCAKRETFEETGLVLTSVSPGPYTNDIFVAEQKHYVTIFVVADTSDGEPQLREPEKCARWAWFNWSNLPVLLFKPLATLRATGFSPQ